MTGTDLVYLVGWLAEQIVGGKRKVSSLSLPRYFSAVHNVW